MKLRLGTSLGGGFQNTIVLVGVNNNIVYEALSIAGLVEKVQKEKEGLQITLLKKEESFVIIEADPESTKNVPTKKVKSAICVIAAKEDELKEFWSEFTKIVSKPGVK